MHKEKKLHSQILHKNLNILQNLKTLKNSCVIKCYKERRERERERDGTRQRKRRKKKKNERKVDQRIYERLEERGGKDRAKNEKEREKEEWYRLEVLGRVKSLCFLESPYFSEYFDIKYS